MMNSISKMHRPAASKEARLIQLAKIWPRSSDENPTISDETSKNYRIKIGITMATVD